MVYKPTYNWGAPSCRIFTYFHRSLSQPVGAQEIALTDVSDECSTVGVVTISWMMYVHHHQLISQMTSEHFKRAHPEASAEHGMA